MKKKDIKILLVDDEPDILEIVGYNLSHESYQVKTAKNGLQAIEKAQKFEPHIILLDIMMPEMDGIETCEKLRAIDKFSNTIIVFFTARGEDYSQLAGFDAGADDYITKPIKPKVLLKKIKALSRRIVPSLQNVTILKFKDLTIDNAAYTVTYKDQIYQFPKKEFELLYLLASQKGTVLKRDYILNKIWGDVIVGDRTIDVHIRKLRKKLGDHFLETIKGVGYKFVADET